MHNFIIYIFFTSKEMLKCGGVRGFCFGSFPAKTKTKPFLSKGTNTFFSLWHCLSICFGSTASQFDSSTCSPLHARQCDTHWCNSHKPGHATQTAPNANIKPPETITRKAAHYRTSRKGQTHTPFCFGISGAVTMDLRN